MEQYEIIDKLRSAGGLTYAEVCRDGKPVSGVYLSRIIAEQKTTIPERTFKAIVRALCNARTARVKAQQAVRAEYLKVCALKKPPSILRLRQAAGLTQRALAAQHGVSATQIQKLEAGVPLRRDVDKSLRKSIASAYSIRNSSWAREADQWRDASEEVGLEDGELQ